MNHLTRRAYQIINLFILNNSFIKLNELKSMLL